MKEKILNRNDNYNLVIDNFEGPLDLLLFLITKNKMNIFDISLSELTDKYIEYLDQMSDLNLDVASSFIVMASTLLDIKSKKLLPEIDEKIEDEISEEDIIARLLEYKKYKEISETINILYKDNFGSFNKPPEKIKFNKIIQYTGEVFEKNDLYEIYKSVLERNLNKLNKKANEIQKLALFEKITVKDKAKQIINYLENNEELIFNKMFDAKEVNNIEIVTAFLSTLELSRLKQIYIEQKSLFSDIYITKNMDNKVEYDFSNFLIE